MIPFINPISGNPLTLRGAVYYDSATNEPIAHVIDRIPRFVSIEDNYAQGFGWQWKKWANTLSDSRNPYANEAKYKLILQRTHFDEFDTKGKTILECGMGGGDDTEVLLRMPFAEVHTFDLSSSVDRARDCLHDDRLNIFQASIFEIPLPDRSFDFVFCHRVLQHTPDPEAALRAICKKVKEGGVLFVHIYHKSWHFQMQFKYKYRWLTKRLPYKTVYNFVDQYGAVLRALNSRMRNSNKLLSLLAYNFIPFQYYGEIENIPPESMLEKEKLDTFDALTPKYDKPMKWRKLSNILRDEGFSIKYARNQPNSPLYCTSEKR